MSQNQEQEQELANSSPSLSSEQKKRMWVSFFIGLLMAVPVGLFFGFILGLIVVAIDGTTGFEGQNGYAMLGVMLISAPVFGIASIIIHVLRAKKRWPKVLFILDGIILLLTMVSVLGYSSI